MYLKKGRIEMYKLMGKSKMVLRVLVNKHSDRALIHASQEMVSLIQYT